MGKAFIFFQEGQGEVFFGNFFVLTANGNRSIKTDARRLLESHSYQVRAKQEQ